MGPGQKIAYPTPALPGQEHHILILSGQMRMTVEGLADDLGPGDCLRHILYRETVFETGDRGCRYLIARR